MAKKKRRTTLTVSDAMWDKVSMENKLYVEEYLNSLTEVSDATYSRYRIDLRQFMYWSYSSLNNKPLHKITLNDFEQFLNVLKINGSALNSINSKKNSLCAFFNYITDKIRPNDEKFKDFPDNFRDVKVEMPINSEAKYPVTFKEFRLLVDDFRRENYLIGVAWVTFMFYTGAGISDYRWLTTDIVEHPFPDTAKYVLSNSIKRKVTNTRKKTNITYKLNREVYDALKAYVDSVDYDMEYIFSNDYNGEVGQVNSRWAYHICQNKISEVLGRNIMPTDFVDSYKVFKKSNPSVHESWNDDILDNLLHMENISTPLDLTNYSLEINRILAREDAN